MVWRMLKRRMMSNSYLILKSPLFSSVSFLSPLFRFVSSLYPVCLLSSTLYPPYPQSITLYPLSFLSKQTHH